MLTPALLRRALDGEAEAIRRAVAMLTPLIQTRVARRLLRRAPKTREVRGAVVDLTRDLFEALLADGGARLLAWEPERDSAAAFVGRVVDEFVAAAPGRDHLDDPRWAGLAAGELPEREVEALRALGGDDAVEAFAPLGADFEAEMADRFGDLRDEELIPLRPARGRLAVGVVAGVAAVAALLLLSRSAGCG